jgi:drug/metabolite transporter (DMT)-like permease
MFIIKFAEPLFACVFSAILLNENIFQWQYLIAFILISTGIVLGNKTKREKENESKNI